MELKVIEVPAQVMIELSATIEAILQQLNEIYQGQDTLIERLNWLEAELACHDRRITYCEEFKQITYPPDYEG